jgi:serine/threonine-protein kinase
MVDEAGEVFVLDFGLVYLRSESSSRLTRPGDLLGTAPYMSPEQARTDDQAPDVATDVYGLGATLYALVTGRPPFEGDSFAAVVAKVLNDEPPPPRSRRPELDPRIEAIIARAMAKDPRRRYPSAAALADDLDRMLAGAEPAARPPGALGRAAGWARRRAALAAIAIPALLVSAAGIGFLARVGGERREAVLALREVARLSLAAALERRRAGDTAAMRKALPRLKEAYEKVLARGAAEGEAEVEYLMGRMHRALMNDPRALAHQERALARDPTHAPALYERVVLLSARYGRALDEALGRIERADGARSLVARAEESNPTLAAMGRALLEQVERLQALPLEESHARAARGILAFHRGQYAEAKARLEEALAADPLMEEAWDALARATDAAGDWNGAETVYARAMERDRGYAPHAIGRCEMRRRMGRYPGAIRDADTALSLDAGLFEAWNCRAAARMHVGHDVMMAGGDPLPIYADAEKDYDEAIARSGGRVGHAGRGTLRRYRAIHRIRRGEDPIADLDASQRDLDRAVALEPAVPERYTTRGRTIGRRAMYRMDQGLDAARDVEAALADFTRGYDLDRRRSDALMWRADLLTHRALFRLERGEAPWDDFAAAEADFAAAIAQYQSDGWAYLQRGTMRAWRGEAESRAGRAAEPSFAGAERDLAQAARRLPRYVDAWVESARLFVARAEHTRRHGGDPARDLVAAAYALDRALAMNPGSAPAWAARVRLEVARGDARAAAAARDKLGALDPALAARLARGSAPPPPPPP